MRLLPFGPVLPVCCNDAPATRLGWVPVPRLRRFAGARITLIAGYDARDLMSGELAPAPRIHTEVARLPLVEGNPQVTILVVKSAETPIEVWREVPGFVEDRYGR